MSTSAKRAILKLFSGNFLSKVLGGVREILVAALFGTGNIAGAYRVAQTATLTPVDFFTKDSLNSAFIPLYKRYLQDSPAKADTLLWMLLVIFFILSGIIGALLWIFSFFWVEILAPGANSSMYAVASPLLKIMGVGVPFYLLSTLFAYIALAKDDVTPMAIRPVLQNIFMIGGVVIAFMTSNPVWLGWGFSACYCALFLWNLVRIFLDGAFPSMASWEWPQSMEVMSAFFRTLRPLLLLPVIQQGNIVSERVVASLVSVSAISALDYSRFITETVIFLISIPVAFVGLSQWSNITSTEIREQMKNLIQLLMICGVPCSLFLGYHAHLIIEILYARGSFDHDSVDTAGDILAGTCIGLWAAVVSYILIKGLNAQLRNKIAMLIMSFGLLANVIVNYTCYQYLGGYVLGMSNSVCAILTFVGGVLAFRLMKEIVPVSTVIAVLSLLYAVLFYILPAPDSNWLELILESVLSLCFWTIAFLCVPSIRHILKKQLKK